MLTEKVMLKTETVFSDDRLNRYLLRKEWDTKKPRATIIMTNPSATDLMTMDYTTLYILNNISKLDFGAVDIVNLSSRITIKLNVNEDLGTDIEKENTETVVFYPLAPQIRFQWVLKTFTLPAIREQTEKNKAASNKSAVTVPVLSPAKNPS